MTDSRQRPTRRADLNVPRATMRMQFHKDFTFDDARALVPYLVKTGVSHLYASPILKARPGSTHGYDCVDVSLVNPELGGESALLALADALHAAGLGLVVDIVPNHMGVGIDNAWWQDVLTWGPASRYAHYFDIDWQSADPLLRGKLLAPFLGNGYGETLASGDLVLAFDAERMAFEVRYFTNHFPIAFAQYPSILEATRHPALRDVASAFAKAAAAADLPRNDRDAREAILGRREAALADARARFVDALKVDGVIESIERALATFDATNDLTRAGSQDAAHAAHQDATHDGADGRARLHALLEAQSYRLSSWRAAADEINYRRFFEVTELAGVRVEHEDVFEAMHATLFRLYRDGVIDSMRVDHVDGLADPRGYCRRLRRRLDALQPQRPPSKWTRPWIVVEKILAPDEDLRADWRVDGTSGYDFMDEVGALLHEPAAAEPLAAFWARATSRPAEFRTEALAARRQILAENLPAEFHAASRALHRVARSDIDTRDIGLVAVQRAYTELLVQMDVYRTYVDARGRDGADTAVLIRALRAAHETVRPSDRPVLAWLDHWLGGDAASDVLPEAPTRRSLTERLKAITRFQQLTPPLAAKSVEDTAFYRYGRLISRNEVGSDPARFALTIDQFHAKCLRRSAAFPHAMLATATHDHKRGADTRARLAVLSEIPQRWTGLVERWMVLNTPIAKHEAVAPEISADVRAADTRAENVRAENVRAENAAMTPPAALAAIAHAVAEDASVPLPEDQSMLIQTLIGAWPLDLAGDVDFDADEVKSRVSTFVERVAAWQEKALRETKRPSDWSMPNERYEATCRAYLDRIMDATQGPFVREAATFVGRIAPIAALNGLVQAALHCTVPGIPDVYQGSDRWDLSLVDPDNRRPVDYAVRGEMPPMDSVADAAALLDRWQDGAIKQALITKLLAHRAEHPSLYARGRYLPVTVDGPQAAHALAFIRDDGRDRIVVVVALKTAAWMDGVDRPLPDPTRWADTTVTLPDELATRSWTDVSTGRRHAAAARLPLTDLLADLPVAVLGGGQA